MASAEELGGEGRRNDLGGWGFWLVGVGGRSGVDDDGWPGRGGGLLSLSLSVRDENSSK